MNTHELRTSLSEDRPPTGLTNVVEALWYAAKGDWERAHGIVQEDDGAAAAWVHAYLHRFEGDHSNAGYWYRRAGKPVATGSLDEEWAGIAAALLNQ